jgi:hypothetical protein
VLVVDAGFGVADLDGECAAFCGAGGTQLYGPAQ